MDVSVIMPFFERQAALDATLRSFEQYENLEIIVIDDGSPTPCASERANVIRLPGKKVGYSPVVPINIGVEYAAHDMIAINLPECRHIGRTFDEMRDAWTPGTYVMAPCWCESGQRWLSHPDKKAPQNAQPEGVGFNFCVLFHRELWEMVGGMSRAFRWGSHWDDTDFAHKLVHAKALFRWVATPVMHTRSAAHSPWVAGGWDRNRQLFVERWNAM